MRIKILVPLLIALTACGDSDDDDDVNNPVDLSGAYTLTVTNADNGCNYPNWTNGQTTPFVQYALSQSQNQATGSVQGIASLFFGFLGIGSMNGQVIGDTASLTADGLTPFFQGTCMYRIRATTRLTLSGDTVTGTTTYRNVTNGDAMCGRLDTCTSAQNVSGTRPARVNNVSR